MALVWRDGDEPGRLLPIGESLLKPTIATIVATMTLALALASRPARAEHAKITSTWSRRTASRRPSWTRRRPTGARTPGPVVKAKVGEPIKIQWMFTNIYPHKTLENVVVHFFVVREEKVGQKELPDLHERRRARDGLRHGLQAGRARPGSATRSGSRRRAST